MISTSWPSSPMARVRVSRWSMCEPTARTQRFKQFAKRKIMFRSKKISSFVLRSAASATFLTALMTPYVPAQTQQTDRQDKHLDIQSSAGDLHVGEDADARKAGLPLYPGARPHHDDDNNNANLSLFTEAFGFKLVVAKYESSDAPAKIIDFY